MKSGLTKCAAVIAALFVVGCSDDDAGPIRPAPPTPELAFYPLDIGSRWEYHHTLHIEFLNESDGSENRPPTHFETTGDRELVGTETIAGVEYVTERQRFFVPGGGALTSWWRYRQDDDGYYRASVFEGDAPGELDPDLDPIEIIRMQYPLTLGDEWNPTGGATIATLEADEVLDLDAGELSAYRISIRTVSMGPDDYRHIWYSTCGLARVVAHEEVLAVDGGTGMQIRLIRHETEELTLIDLATERDCE